MFPCFIIFYEHPTYTHTHKKKQQQRPAWYFSPLPSVSQVAMERSHRPGPMSIVGARRRWRWSRLLLAPPFRDSVAIHGSIIMCQVLGFHGIDFLVGGCFPTHLQNMQPSKLGNLPKFWVKIKNIFELPPPRIGWRFSICGINHDMALLVLAFWPNKVSSNQANTGKLQYVPLCR